MAFNYDELSKLTAGQILDVYLRDGKPIKAKWTGIQFSLSPSGRRETWAAYGNIWPSREALVLAVRGELQQTRKEAEELESELRALTASEQPTSS